MRLDRSQVLSTLAFAILFVGMYFGFDTKPKDHKAPVKTGAQTVETIDFDRMIMESKRSLDPVILGSIESLEDSLATLDTGGLSVKTIESLAEAWHSVDQYLLSAYYYQKLAEMQKVDPVLWSKCGTSFAMATRKNVENEALFAYALKKSRQAFNNAISIDEENITDRIDLAMSYVDFPLEDNPMKGILMLVDLNKKYPDNVSVLLQLGRLSIQTMQLEKAVARLTQVLNLDPENKNAHCLLAEAYSKLGESQKAEQENKFCNSHY